MPTLPSSKRAHFFQKNFSVQHRHLPAGIIAFIFVSLITFSCTKFDTTSLGGDLLPEVDNINTFADTLSLVTSQGFFNDSTRISRSETHALGRINNDPLFGKTTADIYVQLKPSFYPFYLGTPGDTLTGPGTGLDSVVLCLSYKGNWGDSTKPQHLEVYEVKDNTFRDSIYNTFKISYAPAIKPGLLGSADVDVRSLGTQVKFAHGKDSSTNQIRIRLTNANSSFIDDLFTRDSAAVSTRNAFYRDSLFRAFTNGLAIKATSPTSNALMYISLADANTRLEVHFRKRRNNVIDTVYTSLPLKTSVSDLPSATVNNIVRDYSGYPIANPSSSELYLQTAPGTFINLIAPRLNSFKDTNRIIHRASIIIEQVPGDQFTDSIFTPPPYVYLDLKDTGSTVKYKPLYLDLNPSVYYNPDNALSYYPGSVLHSYFGSFPKKRVAVTGRSISYYDLNISRYIQAMVIHHSTAYPMRLFAPYQFNYPQYSQLSIPYDNPIAYGRIRVGSGTNPQYRMRLVIIWSRI